MKRKSGRRTLPTRFSDGNADQFHFRQIALYHNLGGGKFEEVSDGHGVENYWPWGPSIGDLNADGWDDIFIASSMNFPFRYGINSLLLNDHGAPVRGRRVCARNRASQGQSHARAVV